MKLIMTHSYKRISAVLRSLVIIQVGLLLTCSLSAPLRQAQAQAPDRAALARVALAKAAPLATVSPGDLILAMNTLRVSNGLPALSEDPIINAVAQSTAETMAANNMSWHIGDVRGRIAAAGYGGGGTVWATENFAMGNNMSIDQIMQVWGDPDHMRPAVNPAYCDVGAGVAQAANGAYYYILQAAYTSEHACGEYRYDPRDGAGGDGNLEPPVSQLIIPVKVATPDKDGRIYHIVQAGQSFWSIAIAYQVTIHDLEVWNNISREYGLHVGQKLFIPSSNTDGYATPTPVGMVLLATPDAQGKIIHEVQPYQSLISISQAYNTQVDRILALNGWQADWPLQIGQKLLVDPGKATPTPLPPIAQLTPAPDGNYYHEVQSGETLVWIAGLYDISLAELMAWNGLSSASIIRPGQQLLLRVTPPPTLPPATASPTPAQPGRLSTTTQPLITPTSTLTLPAPTPGASAEAQPGLPWLVGLLVAVLAAAGLLIWGWVARRRD